ncbi:MAG: flocculation-associated PEP-CTERM protein PepA [Comamonadaceae bacterium]|nr:flocculation-associated PEP-CTERM protein PepA [Comamonadaceae bacterium]
MLKNLAAASALLAASIGSAHAAATIVTPDGVQAFGGFDWASTASVYVQGYGITSGGTGRAGQTDTFTLTYQAYAVALQDANGGNLSLPGLKTTDGGSGYEYTINAVIQETITCLTDSRNVVRSSINPGTWDVYYHATGDAILSGANGGISGILNGTRILGGVFDSSSDSTVGAQGLTNPGSVTLSGTFRGAVTFQDLSVISLSLAGTTAVSTLQFGNNVTSWVRPNSFDGIGAVGPNTNNNFVGRADANQNFAAVPEPGTLAFVGLSLLSLGAIRRRKA